MLELSCFAKVTTCTLFFSGFKTSFIFTFATGTFKLEMAEAFPPENCCTVKIEQLSIKPKENAEKKVGRIMVYSDRCLVDFETGASEISAANLRYANRVDFLQDRFFILSYCDTAQMTVNNLLFKIMNKEVENECADAFRKLIQSKFKDLETEYGDSRIANSIQALYNAPNFITNLEVEVENLAEQDQTQSGEIQFGKTGKTMTFEAVMDQEGIFLHDPESMEPKHSLLFWSDESPETVEKVKLISSPGEDSFIVLSTKSWSYKFVSI